jgi:GTP-binding protein Era
VVLVTEWGGAPTETEKQIVQSLKEGKIPAILVINKMDILDKKELVLEKIDQMAKLYDFAAVTLISAKTGDGVDRLLGEINAFCTEGPHFFADDTLTDQPERAIIAEIIREKLLHNLRDEVPARRGRRHRGDEGARGQGFGGPTCDHYL